MSGALGGGGGQGEVTFGHFLVPTGCLSAMLADDQRTGCCL
jgi:hypothetical protein